MKNLFYWSGAARQDPDNKLFLPSACGFCSEQRELLIHRGHLSPPC
jgi:hypothetical protein